MFLASPLHSHAIASPDRLAIRTTESDISWRELHTRVRQRASVLTAHGITEGDRVMHDQPVSIDWVTTFLALQSIGATPALVEPSLSEPEQQRRKEPIGASFQSSRVGNQTSDSDFEPLPWSMSRPLFGVWTSGTTGTPAFVTITTQQAIFSAYAALTRLGLSSRDTWLAALPLHHVGGAQIIMRSVITGLSVELHDHFEPAACNEAIDSGRVQAISAVPYMMRRIMDAREDAPFPASLRAIMLGGAATGARLIERLRSVDAPVSLTWGMTETGSHIATNTPGDFRTELAPLPFVDVQSNAGQLQVRGPIVQEDSLSTEDRGELHEGRVSIDGRSDRVIISGGKNIDLDRVAHAYHSHPDIRDVVVIGLEDNTWGARPHLAYTSDRAPVPESSLRSYAGKTLSKYEQPDSIFFIKEFPRHATGKTDVRNVRRLIIEHVTQP